MTFDPQSWKSDAGLVREAEAQFRRTIESYRIHPDLLSEHANHEESIRTGGYANRTLLELVQNAADALAGADQPGAPFSGRVEIVLDTDRGVLYCANAGRPFSAQGIRSISMAHLSGKRGDEIGRFGLGFKSVLSVTDTPQVFSQSISFEFSSAHARAELQKVAPAKRYPVLRTATLIDAAAAFKTDFVLAGLASWATTIVKLPGVMNIGRLRKEIENFQSEFLLFVGAVREVRLRVIGEEPFQTCHLSRDLGNGIFRIERPEGDGDNWIVESRMHAPSAEARREVGEAVSRSEVKVTVAVPTRFGQLSMGEFWSYFPLQDQTTATGLFNAPWSVNDDRTTLLPNGYNREILLTLSDMFVGLLPRLASSEDAAAHLDYMPARGKEIRGFGDKLLTAHIPQLAAVRALIPNAQGVLRNRADLKPLDLTVSFDADVHRAWIVSPNTGEDVPHWRCYTNRTRATRLRDLFASDSAVDVDAGARDVKRALDLLPKRGLLSWLREWAEGDDSQSAANALRTVVGHSSIDGIAEAKVIPTTDGMRSLADRNVVFLNREADVEVDGAVFVDSAFLAEKDVEELLQARGFRNLDPQAILNARLATLSVTAGEEAHTKVWDAVLDVSVPVAIKTMQASTAPIRVPTQDGGWAWPRQVIDIDVDLGEECAHRLLHRNRCVPGVAHGLGVIRQPVKGFPLEDEPSFEEYQEWVLTDLNSRLGPGDRPIDSIELSPGEGPGPFSVLLMLRDACAPAAVREGWTTSMLTFGDKEWICEDRDTERTYSVASPLRWAVQHAGLLRTSRGFRPPSDVVAPSLVRYGGLLPLYQGPRQAVDALHLPDELEEVPPRVLREMLGSDVFPRIDDDVLVEFVLAATRIGLAGVKPTSIPARVKKMIEPRPPNAVYVATTDEQEELLRSRQRPYLRASSGQVEDLVQVVGCRRFEDSFSFSMVIEGQRDGEPITDKFTGLRNGLWRDRVANSKVSGALTIARRVTTEDGVEDQPTDWYVDGVDLVVRSDADEKQVLQFVSDAFELLLDNAQMANVLEVGLNHKLERLRQQARSVKSDAERLDLYIGPDDLKEALPTGLWSALAAQGLVNEDTPVADLFLTVYGSDSLRILADRFRDEGYSDVPSAWAGIPAAISWVRKMGFGAEYAGQRRQSQPEEFVVPGAVHLNKLHGYQKKIGEDLRTVLTQPSANGPAQKAMVELPTGAGKTRVATETMLKLLVDEVLPGTVLWIAQSVELCEQAVQTFQTVWRYLGDERPLTIGRLWEGNTVHEPDTEFAVVVATDAKLAAIMDLPEYEWLSHPVAVFIDEAHRAGGSSRYTRLLRWLGVDGRSWERPLVGLSATPFKGSVENAEGTKDLAARFGHNRLAAFETDAYQELVKLGVLARVEHEILPTGFEITLNDVERTALQSTRLIDRNLYKRIGRSEARMKVLVEHILDQDPDWPILVFTPSVLSAQVLAASLRYRGRTAKSVSGQTGRQERRNVIRDFQDGEIQVLANCDLLVQGFDAPGVRALYIARPTFSPSAYIQMAGRGLRGKENGGKEQCRIVDVADNWGAMNDFLGYREYEDLWKKQGS